MIRLWKKKYYVRVKCSQNEIFVNGVKSINISM